MKRILTLVWMSLIVSCASAQIAFDPDTLDYYVWSFQQLEEGTLDDTCVRVSIRDEAVVSWEAPAYKMAYDEQPDMFSYPEAAFINPVYVVLVENEDVIYDNDEAVTVIPLWQLSPGEWQLTMIAVIERPTKVDDLFSKPSAAVGIFVEDLLPPGIPARVRIRLGY